MAPAALALAPTPTRLGAAGLRLGGPALPQLAGPTPRGGWPHAGRRAVRRRVAAFKEEEDPRKQERSPAPFETSPFLPAFTRRREHTAGRVAALGFAFSLVGELLTGLGPVTQLHYETGLSFKWLYLLGLGLAGWQLVGGVLPGSPTWQRENQQDVRQPAALASMSQPRKFFAQNELLVGRLAMAGFAGACALEYLWGGEAPLAHLGLVQPGTPLAQAPWWVIGTVTLFLLYGLGLFTAPLDSERDQDAL